MNTLRVLIADDEPVALARLRRLLSLERDLQIVGECADGRSAVDAAIELLPDLVFVDIQMPELDGFQVLESLPRDHRPRFVFVTAHAEYAPHAFAADALDYLVKPFDADRLRATVARARERRSTAEAEGPRTYLERIVVRGDGRIFFVRTDEIEFIEAAANYVRVHTDGKVHLVRGSLSYMAGRLDPSKFARIHRGTIVNIDRIKEIQPWFSGDGLVVLRTGHKLRLSRSHRSVLSL